MSFSSASGLNAEPRPQSILPRLPNRPEGPAKSGFRYQGVIGIDFLGKQQPVCFETWNGRKPIYIFDEDEQCYGMGFTNLPLARSGGPPARSAARKKKQRRRMADQSRRRNR